MQTHFTTECAPAGRRLALWQDIVCDVYVQLDCKSNLRAAFHGGPRYASASAASNSAATIA